MDIRKKIIRKYQLEVYSWRRKISYMVVSICAIQISLLIFFFVAAEFDFSKISSYSILLLNTSISSPFIWYLRFCIREYRTSNNLRNSVTLSRLNDFCDEGIKRNVA